MADDKPLRKASFKLPSVAAGCARACVASTSVESTDRQRALRRIDNPFVTWNQQDTPIAPGLAKATATGHRERMVWVPTVERAWGRSCRAGMAEPSAFSGDF